MSILKRAALRTPFIKEVALRRLGPDSLRESILNGLLPAETLHQLATLAVSQPERPVVSAQTVLSAAEFASLALRSGRLAEADYARLVVIASTRWDVGLTENDFARAATLLPETARYLAENAGPDAASGVQRALLEGGIPEEYQSDVRMALEARTASGPSRESATPNLRDRAGRILDTTPTVTQTGPRRTL